MAAQNLLEEGIDLAGRDAVTGTQINQSVREATLVSNLAMILVDPAPDVASNPAFERFVKIDEAGSWFEYYDTGTSAWVDIPLPDGFITADMIGDNEVNINKLDATGGTALQIIRVSADGTQLEFADLEVADSSVTVGKIVPGADPYMIMVTNDDNSAAVWMSATDLFVGLAKVVGLANLTQSSAATDDVPTWNGTNWVAAGVETLIPAASIALSKLTIGAGTAYQLVRVNAGATAFETASLAANSVTPGTANQVFQTSADGLTSAWRTLFTKSAGTAMSSSTTTLAAALTYTPKIIRCVCSPVSTQNGYSTTDEVDAFSFSGGEVASANYGISVWYDSSAGSFNAIFQEKDAAAPLIHNKSTRDNEAVTVANWNVYFIYSNF